MNRQQQLQYVLIFSIHRICARTVAGQNAIKYKINCALLCLIIYHVHKRKIEGFYKDFIFHFFFFKCPLELKMYISVS